jgi:hypothetical protein
MIASNRIRRSSLKARAATTRAQASIARRGEASLRTYAVSAGLPIKGARSVAGSLRKAAAKLHLTGTQHRVHRAGHMRLSTRYAPAQVAQMLALYKPRRPEYRAARAHLLYALAA